MRLLAIALISMVVLSACERKDLVIWSPDGNRLAVIASDGLRIGDRTGKLGAPVLVDAKFCRWLPDSKRVIAALRTTTTSWNDVKDLLPPSEKQIVIRMANKIWKTRSLSPSKTSLDGRRQAEALQYLMSAHDGKELKLGLGKLLKKYGSSFGSVDIDTVETVDLSGTDQVGKRILWRSIQSIEDMQISRDGRLAAVCVETDLTYKIVLLPVNGGKAITAVASLAGCPEWTLDGKSLLYISYPPVQENRIAGKSDDTTDNPFLSTVRHITIADSEGKILPRFAPPKKLADVFAADASRVRCLPNNDIVFNAKQRTYPSVSLSSEPHSALYRLSSDYKTIEPIAGSSDLPGDAMQYFEPNQDGTKIAVPGNHGEIAVLDLLSNKVTTLEKSNDRDLKFSPQWRTADELSFPSRNAVKSDHGHNIDVVVQSVFKPDERIILSKNWSTAQVEFLQDLTDPPQHEQKLLNNGPIKTFNIKRLTR